jgi:hypothetical protein
VWRAATQVDPSDLRPTGPPQLSHATQAWQWQLDKRLATDTCGDRQWRQLLAREVPSATAEPFMPELEERLSNLTRAGYGATLLVRSAAAAAPLPDDHPAAALWWRILDQLPQTPNQEPATPRQSQRPGARPRPHTTSSHRCRARRPLPRSVRAAENVHTSQRWRSVSQDLLPNLSADQGRLLRGGDWHLSAAGLRHFGERRLGKDVQTTSGGCR